MKKVVLFLAIVANCFAYDADVFRDGFEAGLKALQFQIKNDGAIPQKIALDKNLIVILPTDNIAINEIIYIQYIANKEDFKTNLAQDGIIFGNYDRMVDAKEAVERIKRVLNYDANIMENKGEFWTNPIIAKPVYDLVSDGLTRDGAIKDVRIIYVPTHQIANNTTQKKAKASTPLKIKNAVLKGTKAQAYRLDGNNQRSGNYKESFIAEGMTFKTANTIVTKEGEVFVKVLNENIYFLKSDVEFL